MGCRLTRTASTELCEKQADASPKEKNGEKERRTVGPNGQSVLLRRDTPHGGLGRNGNSAQQTLNLPSKPIGEVESASQTDFFRMLDDKIQNGRDFDSELDD